MASAPALSSGNPDAFGKRGVLALVLFGTLAFVVLLYLIGAGGMTGPANKGQSHAGSKGLTGYTALADLLEAEGHEVSISRSEAALDDEALLILTPPGEADEEQVASIIENRRYIGPTLIVMPKWNVNPASQDNAKSGWVQLRGVSSPNWNVIIDAVKIRPESVTTKEVEARKWSAEDGSRGSLPASIGINYIDDKDADLVIPLATADRAIFRDSQMVLAALYDDGNASNEVYPVTIVAEPDLMNNWGMADQARAELAHRIVDLAAEDTDQPIIFDVTLNGLGGSRNLLTLAFTPPFVAATLSLILALMLVGWRAFRRFGPALAAAPTIAFGKGQLVENGAGVIQRTGRMHLLTGPYAALSKARIAHLLGVRGQDHALIDEALTRRGLEPLSPRLSALENARHRADVIRAARALHSLERTLTR